MIGRITKIDADAVVSNFFQKRGEFSRVFSSPPRARLRLSYEGREGECYHHHLGLTRLPIGWLLIRTVRMSRKPFGVTPLGGLHALNAGCFLCFP